MSDEKPSIEEMRDALLTQLYDQRTELKGVALVNGLKALATLVQQEKSEPVKSDVVEPHNLLDQIYNVPVEHAVRLLEVEIGRLEKELAAHRAALGEMRK